MMVVDITPGSPLGIGTPNELFKIGDVGGYTHGRSSALDFDPIGDRFAIAESVPEDASTAAVIVVLNILELLDRLAEGAR